MQTTAGMAKLWASQGGHAATLVHGRYCSQPRLVAANVSPWLAKSPWQRLG